MILGVVEEWLDWLFLIFPIFILPAIGFLPRQAGNRTKDEEDDHRWWLIK
jgi:hypothetical protein